jgi:hypothetical protein
LHARPAAASSASGGLPIFLLTVSLVLVAVSVGVHYEALQLAYRLVAMGHLPHRLRIVVGILTAFAAHSAEAMLFAVGWTWLIQQGVAGLSIANPDFTDVVYFSFSTYTSLGYGDIVPVGNGRVLAGIESLLGLVLIAWTASYTYLEMQENWNKPDD